MGAPGWGLSGWGDPFVQQAAGVFDAILTNTCTIYRVEGRSPNKYNVVNQTPVLVLDNVPCRLSTLGGKSPQAGHEYVDPKQVEISHYKIFMRPQTVEITNVNFIVIEGRYFNILSVLKLRGRNNTIIHHLEIFCEETYPSDFTIPNAS